MPAEICKRLQECMDTTGISYGDLSKMTGIPKSAIHRYVTGQTAKIPLNRLELLAAALSVPASYLMGWKSQENPTPGTADLTPHEKAVISAYRSRPSMQPAVDKLLGIEED